MLQLAQNAELMKGKYGQFEGNARKLLVKD